MHSIYTLVHRFTVYMLMIINSHVKMKVENMIYVGRYTRFVPRPKHFSLIYGYEWKLTKKKKPLNKLQQIISQNYTIILFISVQKLVDKVGD